MTKLKLTVLSISSYKLATPGKFRIVLWTESEPYQVDDEVDSLDDAQRIKKSAEPFAVLPSLLPTIYNDKGETC